MKVHPPRSKRANRARLKSTCVRTARPKTMTASSAGRGSSAKIRFLRSLSFHMVQTRGIPRRERYAEAHCAVAATRPGGRRLRAEHGHGPLVGDAGQEDGPPAPGGREAEDAGSGHQRRWKRPRADAEHVRGTRV